MTRVAAGPYVAPLETLAGVVRELELVAGHSLQEYRDGMYVKRAAERLVQLGVDLACGLAIQVLGRSRERLPSGSEEVFRDLAKAGLLPLPLAEKMIGVVALRRRILYGFPTQPGEDADGDVRPDPDEDLHRRLPFLSVLLREYGRHVEELVKPA